MYSSSISLTISFLFWPSRQFLYRTHVCMVADKITDIRSDAAFVLLVEKEAAYMRMAEDRFYHKYPCIIITAKGQPDVAR